MIGIVKLLGKCDKLSEDTFNVLFRFVLTWQVLSHLSSALFSKSQADMQPKLFYKAKAKI